LANDYINEQRYCNAFAHDKLRYQKWGKKKIAYALHSKRIATNIIEDALKNIDETEYNTILSKLITQKKGATKEQVTRFCMQRGFEYSRINELLCYIDSETTADMD
jgi:regulatory protein